jgi:hypothetical protein
MAAKIPVDAGDKVNEERLFQDVESATDLEPGRARTIAVWLGLFVCAILVSQFGRPSRAREAEFMRGAAKVEKLGKASTASGGEDFAARNSAVRLVDEKDLAPAVYANHRYGVAWQYPRSFVLRKGANVGLDLSGHYAASSAFAVDGGVPLASVIIPGRVYAGTDFVKASLTARVNSKASEEACGQFRVSDGESGTGREIPASEITVGSTEFAAVEVDVDGDPLRGAETWEKFFHVYENAACYEFAMSVTAGTAGDDDSLRHVEPDEVFERLTEILTSVTIVPVRVAGESAVPGSVAPRIVAPERHK